MPREICNLYSQIVALSRRIGWHVGNDMHVGEFMIDQYKRMVIRDHTPLPLQRREFDIFLYLAERRGRVITREILNYGTSTKRLYSQNNAVDVHVSNIRKKIADSGSDPNLIQTVYGVGYRMI